VGAPEGAGPFCDLSFGRYNQDPRGWACRDSRFPPRVWMVTIHRRDSKSPASSEVSAAEASLKFSMDSIELDDLEGRLEALEQQAPPRRNGRR
jgi:hypothetical protein